MRASAVGSLDGKPVVPDHNVFLIPLADPDEVFYVSALLNSTPGDFSIRSFFSTGGGGIASPVVLEHIRIPKYDPSDPVHRALAEASREAHAAAAQGDTARLAEIEARVDALAAELWGLTARELASLRRT